MRRGWVRRLGVVAVVACLLAAVAEAPVAAAPVSAAPVAAEPLTGTISGTFVSATRGPIGGVLVQAVADGGHPVNQMSTAADGSYSMTLPPGRYFLRFSGANHAEIV